MVYVMVSSKYYCKWNLWNSCQFYFMPEGEITEQPTVTGGEDVTETDISASVV
jgi:hypothetical protein